VCAHHVFKQRRKEHSGVVRELREQRHQCGVVGKRRGRAERSASSKHESNCVAHTEKSERKLDLWGEDLRVSV
jgi:hypothetical protein